VQAYWPFHKSACRRNDFADAIEQQEPQFAAWMRKHAKLAVLQVRQQLLLLELAELLLLWTPLSDMSVHL
jgi:hypothetical protein